VCEHYGIEMLTEYLLDGVSLMPLITEDQICATMRFQEVSVATNFLNRVIEKDFVAGLNLVVRVITAQRYEFSLHTLATALSHKLTDFMAILRSPNFPKPLVTSAGVIAPPVGFRKLAIVSLFAAIAAKSIHALLEEVLLLQLPEELMSMIRRYPNNNFLHTEACRFFTNMLDNPTSAMKLLSNSRFVVNLMAMIESQRDVRQNSREGYVGHVMALARRLQQLGGTNADICDYLAGCDGWKEFGAVIHEIQSEYDKMLAGPTPPRIPGYPQ